MDDPSLDEFSAILTALSGGAAEVGTRKGRLRVAAAYGYLDARFMVYMMETHGFPLSLCAVEAKKRNLKVRLSGLRYELERIGKKPSTIDSELKEIQFFLEIYEERKAAHVHPQDQARSV